MLIKTNGVLVPHDIDANMLNFILNDKGASRFVICLHIPEASDHRFMYDTAHIEAINGELRIHSQRTSRTYQLHMYAWEHVYCLMPSAKHKRKADSGWVHPEAPQIIKEPDFPQQWHSEGIQQFVEKNSVAP